MIINFKNKIINIEEIKYAIIARYDGNNYQILISFKNGGDIRIRYDSEGEAKQGMKQLFELIDNKQIKQ